VTVPQAFDLALQHHQAGRLAEAEALYREILTLQPNHADALHFIGIIFHQTGRHDLAIGLIGRSIGLNPNNPAAHGNLGEACRATGRLDEAMAAYHRAIALHPAYPEAHNNLGNVLRDQGRMDEALEAYRRAIELKPDDSQFHNNLGNALREMGRHEEAVRAYRRALEIRPDDANAHNNLGDLFKCAGQLDDAVAAYREALRVKPDNLETRLNLGDALKERGAFDRAVEVYRAAIRIRPDFAEAHNRLGNTLAKCGRFEDAEASYRRAIAIRPDFTDAHLNLGKVLKEQGRIEEALGACRRALELEPERPEAHSNLGNVLLELGQLDEAVAACRRGLELAPDNAEVQNSLACALLNLGQTDAALGASRRAYELAPSRGAVKFNHAFLLLLCGDLEHGWPLYEARREVFRLGQRDFSQPIWDGGTVQGRRVLIHPEQGLGDSIQFIRYAELLAARGAEVIVECQDSLVELFRSARGVSAVVAAGAPLPPFDLHVPMLSLPLAFQTKLESIPRQVPYLFADPARRETWRARLGGGQARWRVGIAWASNPNNFLLRKRHVPFEKLHPLLRVEDVEFVSLQVGPSAEQIQRFAGTASIVDHTAHIRDFADTAALMAELDLIISVDTAVPHLAGALARPVWTLLPFAPDWRWGREGGETPWYPTMQLFRQPAMGDWDSVIERVTDELSRAVTAGSVGSPPPPC